MKFELSQFKDPYNYSYLQFFRGENFYIVTSHKVASSTLHAIKELQHIYYYDDSYITYVLVRNPYKRIESIYRDKVLGMKQNADQYCQLELLKFFNKIDNISFKSFIQDFLPFGIYKETHFFPQTTYIPNFLKNVKLLKMEIDMSFIFYLTNSKFVHINKTEESNVTWDADMRKTINNLYQEDFLNFGYDIID